MAILRMAAALVIITSVAKGFPTTTTTTDTTTAFRSDTFELEENPYETNKPSGFTTSTVAHEAPTSSAASISDALPRAASITEIDLTELTNTESPNNYEETTKSTTFESINQTVSPPPTPVAGTPQTIIVFTREYEETATTQITSEYNDQTTTPSATKTATPTTTRTTSITKEYDETTSTPISIDFDDQTTTPITTRRTTPFGTTISQSTSLLTREYDTTSTTTSEYEEITTTSLAFESDDQTSMNFTKQSTPSTTGKSTPITNRTFVCLFDLLLYVPVNS